MVNGNCGGRTGRNALSASAPRNISERRRDEEGESRREGEGGGGSRKELIHSSHQ